MKHEGSPRTPDVETADELDEKVRQEMRRRSRRGFLVGGAAALAGVAAWEALKDAPPEDGIPGPYRKMLDFNAKVARRFFRAGALAPEFDRSRVVPQFRRNGDIGLSDIDAGDWRLQLVGAAHPESHPQYVADVMQWTYGLDEGDDAGQTAADSKPRTHEQDAKGAAVAMKPMRMPENPPKVPGLLLTMDDVLRLPRREMTVQFKCVEGWSEIVHWGGARLADFIAAYPPPMRDGNPFDPDTAARRMPGFVGFETPDGQYYVGIEREAALHPQTLLAYELNWQPLGAAHGAPLRLVTPLKYGIKNLKQIGRMYYSDRRPRDYWFEQGYDYYAGL